MTKSIPQLIQLNRELRESIIKGLAGRVSGLDDGKYWPLFHLLIQVLRRHEALELLATRNLGQEAGMMLRSIFEATVNAVWISKDVHPRMKRYHAYQFFSAKQYRDLAEKRGIRSDNITTIKQENGEKSLKQKAEEEGWREMEKYNFKKGAYWSGIPLKQMADEIGWATRYEFEYKLYSDITHAGASSG